jgi:hypothetical protein
MKFGASIAFLAASLFSAVRGDGMSRSNPLIEKTVLTSSSRAMGAHRQEQLGESST